MNLCVVQDICIKSFEFTENGIEIVFHRDSDARALLNTIPPDFCGSVWHQGNALKIKPKSTARTSHKFTHEQEQRIIDSLKNGLYWEDILELLKAECPWITVESIRCKAWRLYRKLGWDPWPHLRRRSNRTAKGLPWNKDSTDVLLRLLEVEKLKIKDIAQHPDMQAARPGVTERMIILYLYRYRRRKFK